MSEYSKSISQEEYLRWLTTVISTIKVYFRNDDYYIYNITVTDGVEREGKKYLELNFEFEYGPFVIKDYEDDYVHSESKHCNYSFFFDTNTKEFVFAEEEIKTDFVGNEFEYEPSSYFQTTEDICGEEFKDDIIALCKLADAYDMPVHKVVFKAPMCDIREDFTPGSPGSNTLSYDDYEPSSADEYEAYFDGLDLLSVYLKKMACNYKLGINSDGAPEGEINLTFTYEVPQKPKKG